MKKLMHFITGLLLCSALNAAEAKSVHDFTMTTIDGKKVKLDTYKGKVLLIVNVASKCGLTGQYKGLQELYKSYEKKGVIVLGFPANNFGKQEPGTDKEIKKFCTSKYSVTFPMISKVSVKGKDIDPLFKFLTADKKFGGEVKWNFNKFLIGPDGTVINRFEPGIKPGSKEVLAVLDKETAKK